MDKVISHREQLCYSLFLLYVSEVADAFVTSFADDISLLGHKVTIALGDLHDCGLNRAFDWDDHKILLNKLANYG